MIMDGIRKHTPGPWGMETLRTSCGVCHKVGPWPHKWRAGETMSACIYDDYPSPPEGTDTMLANARLIAAAPELLAALKAVADLKGWTEQAPIAATGIQVMAAIAKAEGR
jgi:hypothetical protein